MNVTRKLATVITAAAFSISCTAIAAAGENYTFPSASGVQLSASPAPGFVSPQPNVPGVSVANTFVYGQPALARHELPLPPPGYAGGPAPGVPYANRLMSHALMVAPYANYAADYARLFAPNYAVSAWTDRVFGVVDSGYSAVDGWTAAAYGMPRLQGSQRYRESSPDLTLMPTFRAHPELDRNPTFRNGGN